MSTLYLDRKGLELRLDGAALALYENGNRARTVPLALLDRVVIRAETALTSGVLGALAEAGTSVAVLSGRQGRRLATVLGRLHNDARIRLAQYRHRQDPGRRIAWARRLVRAKTRNQIVLMERARRERPDLRKPLFDALGSLRAAQARVVGHDDTLGIASLLGIEGAAQAAYFRGYTALFPESLGFRGRTRRPPRDPVNACLSLAYTLVHLEAVRAAWAAGLDPFVGFLHELSFARESFACDLVEPLRPHVDAWAWEMFRNRVLRPEHFTEDKGACVLHKGGRAHFYEHFERFQGPMSRSLRRHCRAVVRTLLEREPQRMVGADEDGELP